MAIKLKIIFILLLGYSSFLCAQDGIITERDIKLSRNYYYGEGIRDSLQQAKADAIQNLQYNISVKLESTSESFTSETSEAYSSSYTKSIKMTSTIKLRDVQFLDKELSSDKWKVIAFISRDKYSDLLKEIHEEVVNLSKNAEQKEKSSSFVDAIPNYYKAYLSSYFSPQPVAYSSATFNEDYVNIRNFLESKIRSYLVGINLTLDEIKIDPDYQDYITTSFKVAYNDNPVNNLVMSYNLPGNPEMIVSDGKVDLYLYEQPSNLIQKYEINFIYEFKGDTELQKFNDDFPISETQFIEIDFSDFVAFDFRIEKSGGGFLTFIPIVKNLSVSSIHWQLDKKIESRDTKASIKYDEPGAREVTLTVNGLDQLKVVKLVDDNGNILSEIDLEIEQSAAKIHPVINDLLQYKTYDLLIEPMNKYKNSGRMIFGASSTFKDLDACYGIVIDPNSRRVKALFTPKEETRTDLISNSSISDYKTQYRNNYIIWLQVY